MGAVLLVASADRLFRWKPSPICGGQLIACSVSTLVVLAAMAVVPVASAGHGATGGSGMAGMPGMGGGTAMAQGAGLAAHLPSVAAAVVLVIFLVRAGIEGSRAIRAGRDTGVRPIGHVAAVAGALSMVVMCTAMMAI